MDKPPYSLWENRGDHVLMYGKGNVLFAFNFDPTRSFEGYFVPTHKTGTYEVLLCTDADCFGGAERVDATYRYKATKRADGRIGFDCYLPSRCAIVFGKVIKKK